MPSPSKSTLLSSLAITVGVFFGGAWLASGMTSGEAGPAAGESWAAKSPMIAPAPNIANTQELGVEAQDTASPHLQLTIQGVNSMVGQVVVLVFDDPSAFNAGDYNRAVAYVELPASTSPIRKAFEDLTSGPYAVLLFHDANGNQDFDMAEGYPIEGYGTSNASGPNDIPSFQQASVDAGPVTIKVHYVQ